MTFFKRRSSVLIYVLCVVVLLFAIGATLLLLSHYGRKSAMDSKIGRNIEDIHRGMQYNVMYQLRLDAVGRDGVPYNGR